MRDVWFSWSCRVAHEGELRHRACTLAVVLRAGTHLLHLAAHIAREGLRTVRREDDFDWLTTRPAVVEFLSLMICVMDSQTMTANHALQRL